MPLLPPSAQPYSRTAQAFTHVYIHWHLCILHRATYTHKNSSRNPHSTWYTCTHVHTRADMYIHMRMCTQTYTYTHKTRIHAHPPHTPIPPTHTCIYKNPSGNPHIYFDTHTHAHTRTHKQTYACTHACAHMRKACTHMSACTHSSTHTQTERAQTCMYMQAHAQTRTCEHAHTEKISWVRRHWGGKAGDCFAYESVKLVLCVPCTDTQMAEVMSSCQQRFSSLHSADVFENTN